MYNKYILTLKELMYNKLDFLKRIYSYSINNCFIMVLCLVISICFILLVNYTFKVGLPILHDNLPIF